MGIHHHIDRDHEEEGNDGLFQIETRVYNTVDALETFTESLHGTIEISDEEKWWVKEKLLEFAGGLRKIIACILEEHSDIFTEDSLKGLVDYANLIVDESGKNEGMTEEDRNQLIMELFSATKVLVELESMELREKTREALDSWMDLAVELMQSIADKIEEVPEAVDAFSYIVSQ